MRGGMMNERIARAVSSLFPECELLEVRALDGDDGVADDTHKAAGYGAPRRVRLRTPAGERSLVFHVQRADGFGHERRADRAAEQLLAWDTFAQIPRQARAYDVGAIDSDGHLFSLARAGELYLITEWVEGAPYADDLRRIARTREATRLDLERCDALSAFLVELHARRLDDPLAWRRSVRDLVGGGEGIFGMIDGYPRDTPGAPPARLQAIERRCIEWRARLRDRSDRLAAIHGDFHPFNVVFESGSSFRLLDASRGCAGDPADDVSAMAINYVFFALDHPGAWQGALRSLWLRFFAAFRDRELPSVIAPYLAWRALVVASPVFYPSLPGESRDRILTLAERALDAPRFDPVWADAVFA
jgi:hypothetical protein